MAAPAGLLLRELPGGTGDLLLGDARREASGATTGAAGEFLVGGVEPPRANLNLRPDVEEISRVGVREVGIHLTDVQGVKFWIWTI